MSELERDAAELDRRYTLAEAERELARRECRAHGHDWTVLMAGFEPAAITCTRCGEHRRVVK